MGYTNYGFAVTVFVYCFFILALKMLFVAFATGFARKKAGSVASPEDAKLTGGSHGETPEPVKRWRRIHRNDMENIIPFIMVYTAFLFTVSNNGAEVYIGTIFAVIFVLSRIGHTISYAFGLQPWRSITFFVGLLATIALGILASILTFINNF